MFVGRMSRRVTRLLMQHELQELLSKIHLTKDEVGGYDGKRVGRQEV